MPKKIWFLWLQGFENMPLEIAACYDSWKNNNSGWELLFLDEKNIGEYLDLEKILESSSDQVKIIKRVTLSEIIRINLLSQYGGVWVDSSCYCCIALDDWLHDKMTSGFFTFANPGKDRMLTSWFLAAKENNSLVKIYAKQTNRFRKQNKYIKAIEDRKWIYLFFKKIRIYRILYRNTGLWFIFPFVKIFRVYPYFWFHYFFKKLYLTKKEVKEVWDNTPKISANGPHTLFDYGLLKSLDNKIKNHIDQKKTPVYKLTWKYDKNNLTKDSVLNYLLNNSH